MNMNDLAIIITKLEGKKKSLSIAQIKEVINILIDLLAEEYIGRENKEKTPVSDCIGNSIEKKVYKKLKGK